VLRWVGGKIKIGADFVCRMPAKTIQLSRRHC
jgi:hypothetical protein